MKKYWERPEIKLISVNNTASGKGSGFTETTLLTQGNLQSLLQSICDGTDDIKGYISIKGDGNIDGFGDVRALCS